MPETLPAPTTRELLSSARMSRVAGSPDLLAVNLEAANLETIAAFIAASTTPHPAALPYLDALRSLDGVSPDANLRASTFYADSLDSIVRYLLNNLRTWRGPEARAVKAELRRRLG